MVGGRRLGFAGGERFRLVLSPHVRLRRCSCSSGFYFCCLGGGGGGKEWLLLSCPGGMEELL